MPPPPPTDPHPLVLVPSLPPLRARFCWSTQPAGPTRQVHLFRRTFDLAEIPDSLRLLLTADSRYVLHVNGTHVGRGPLKGTLENYPAETYEIAPLLRAGKNVLAVEVRWFGPEDSLSVVHSAQPGLFVQGLANDELDTPGNWRVWADPSITPGWDDPFQEALPYLGPLDRIDARQRPPGWVDPGFDDAHWPVASAVGSPLSPDPWGTARSHRLVPRDIPALTEEPANFVRILEQRQPINLPWHLPAGQGGEVWLDAGALTTSYPELSFEGGTGREVRIVYAEALGRWDADHQQWRKHGRRDDVAAGEPHGYRDVVMLPGGPYRFEPFHWRTFWFIKLEIPPGDAPVTLRAVSHRFTTFPQAITAHFTCAEPDTGIWWATSLRTLQLCAHETYEDCPYFEQLSYIGDTRLQALCSQYLANDNRLGRRALTIYRDSIDATGLTASRAPARGRQVIPAFSLHWILMLGDHWQWTGEKDRALIRSCLGPMDAVLRYFRDRLDDHGFVGRIDDWAWIDWVPAWPRGVSPVVQAGESSTFLTALYALALQTGIELHRAAGAPDDAQRWSALLPGLQRVIRDSAWSDKAGYFLEGPTRTSDPLTQHTQVMALLAGAASPGQIRRLGRRLTEDRSLVPMSLFHRFYLARALVITDGYDQFFPTVLEPWREMTALGLSTWLEQAEPSRSDCHAWSSWMVIEFFATILGARPGRPGWTAIHIEPCFQATTAAAGEFPIPSGTLRISWQFDGDHGIMLSIDAPPGVPVTVCLPAAPPRVFPEGGAITLTHALPAT